MSDTRRPASPGSMGRGDLTGSFLVGRDKFLGYCVLQSVSHFSYHFSYHFRLVTLFIDENFALNNFNRYSLKIRTGWMSGIERVHENVS